MPTSSATSAMPILSSTLADLGGVREGVLHSVPDMAGNFYTVSARPGDERNLMSPYFAANGRDGIAESEKGFWIPSDGSGPELARAGEIVGPQRDDGEQGEQGRSGAQDGLVGPLALGLDAEMGANFLESELDLPAADEPSENVVGMSVEVSCQECLRVELAGWITDQEPADRHRRH